MKHVEIPIADIGIADSEIFPVAIEYAVWSAILQRALVECRTRRTKLRSTSLRRRTYPLSVLSSALIVHKVIARFHCTSPALLPIENVSAPLRFSKIRGSKINLTPRVDLGGIRGLTLDVPKGSGRCKNMPYSHSILWHTYHSSHVVIPFFPSHDLFIVVCRRTAMAISFF